MTVIRRYNNETGTAGSQWRLVQKRPVGVSTGPYGGTPQPLPTTDVDRVVYGPLTGAQAANLPTSARSGSRYMIMRAHDNDVAPVLPNDDPRCEVNGFVELAINTVTYTGYSTWHQTDFPNIPRWMGGVNWWGPPFTQSPVVGHQWVTINGILTHRWTRSRGIANQEGAGTIGSFIDVPWQARAPLGRWVDWVWAVRWSKSASLDPNVGGWVEIYMDGVKQTFTSGPRSLNNTRLHTPTMFSTASPETYEVRMTCYRDRGQVTEATGGRPYPGYVQWAWDDVVNATTFAEADPAQGASTPVTGAPILTTEQATNVTTTSATLNGTVNPNGISTLFSFQYAQGAAGTVPNLDSTIVNVGAGTAPVTQTYAFTGLTAGATYQFRSKAQNSAGTTFGPIRSFVASPTTAVTQPTAAVTSALSTPGTTLTWTKPSGLTNGDMLVWVAKLTGSATVSTAPTGSTQYGSPLVNATETAVVYYKVITNSGTEPASYTLTASASHQHIGTQLHLRGQHSTPFTGTERTYVWDGVSTDPDIILPAFTPVNDDALVIAFGGNAQGDSSGAASWTPPVGFEELVDVNTGTASTNRNMMVAVRSQTGGANSPLTGLTFDNTTGFGADQTVARVFAIRPATATADTTAPAPPENLTLTGTVLDWSDNAESDLHATQPYLIERRTLGGAFTQIATSTTSTYTDASQAGGTYYEYLVRAKDTSNNVSGASNIVATPVAPPVTIPAAPTGVVAVALGPGEIQVSWAPNTEQDLHPFPYIVERASDPEGGWTSVIVTNDTNHLDTGLQGGVTYYYRVRARDNETPIQTSPPSDYAFAQATSIDTPVEGVSDLELVNFDGLEINAGNVLQLDAIDVGIPKMRAEWIGAADSEHQALARVPKHENRQITMTVAVAPRASMDSALAAIGALTDKLQRAAKNPAGIPFRHTPAGSSVTVTYEVLSGEVTGLPQNWESGWLSKAPTVEVMLTAKPYGLLAEQFAPAQTFSTPTAVVGVENVKGDVPALGRVVITDSAAQARRFVEFGIEPEAQTGPLFLEGNDLVTSGYGAAAATGAGAYNSGNERYMPLLPTNTATAMFGTGTQTHVGEYRVILRCRPLYTDTALRFAYRVGDGPLVRLAEVAPVSANTWQEIDLGTVTIERMQAGDHSWSGHVEARNTGTASNNTIYADYLIFVPVTGGYGKARASYTYIPGVQTAADLFTNVGNGVALNGIAANTGGTWATSGATTDFAGDTTFVLTGVTGSSTLQVQRSTLNDTSPRVAALGATNFTNTESYVGTTGVYNAASYDGLIHTGVIARHSASGYVSATIIFSRSAYTFHLSKTLSGVLSHIASTPAVPYTAGSWQNFVRLVVYSSGQAVATLMNNAGVVLAQLQAADTDFATGGTLATGKPGLVDRSESGTLGTREAQYSRFSAGTPTAEPIAIYPSQALQITHDGVYRENAGGTGYGALESYRGSRVLFNPGTSRLLIRARRVDTEKVGADTNVADATTVQVFWRPRILTVPRS